jgi:hypothetical protein
MGWIKKNKAELVIIVSIILISMISFNFGKIKATRDFNEKITAYDNGGEISDFDFQVVVSVNSNKYHFPWCSGASTIKDSNKIFFENEAAALAAGYVLAGNCSK